jgi:hypothetical protein
MQEPTRRAGDGPLPESELPADYRHSDGRKTTVRHRGPGNWGKTFHHPDGRKSVTTSTRRPEWMYVVGILIGIWLVCAPAVYLRYWSIPIYLLAGFLSFAYFIGHREQQRKKPPASDKPTKECYGEMQEHHRRNLAAQSNVTVPMSWLASCRYCGSKSVTSGRRAEFCGAPR